MFKPKVYNCSKIVYYVTFKARCTNFNRNNNTEHNSTKENFIVLEKGLVVYKLEDHLH